VLAIHARPLALVRDLRRVHAGTGIVPARAFSAVASTLEVEASPPGCEMSYTIDGDLYQCKGPLRITLGPQILLVKPVRALIAYRNGDTMKAGR
jgi:hypothetical protein